jgi:hypothetical protein
LVMDDLGLRICVSSVKRPNELSQSAPANHFLSQPQDLLV